MKKSAPTTIKLSVPSQFGYEKIAMDTAVKLAKSAGLSKERQEDLSTAVSEACINAMQHGNHLSAKTDVNVVFRVKKNVLEVEIRDKGRGLDSHPERPILENKLKKDANAGGWGVFLMEKLVDRVEDSITKSRGHLTRLVMELNKSQ